MPAMSTKSNDGSVTKDAAVLRLSLQQLASDYLNLLATKNALLLDLEAANARLAAVDAERNAAKVPETKIRSVNQTGGIVAAQVNVE
jgi:hypothetical protein